MAHTQSQPRLPGVRVVIVGAASPVGSAIAESLAREGAVLLLADRDPDAIGPLAERVRGAGGRASLSGVDLNDADSVAALFAAVDERVEGIDVLVNCLEAVAPQDFLEISEEDFLGAHTLNTCGVLLTTQHAAHRMVAAKSGVIVNVCAQTARHPTAGSAADASTHAAVVSLTQSAAKSFGPQGVRINAVAAPLYVLDAVRVEPALPTVLPSTVKSADVASVVLFLASTDSAAMTGQVLLVDGGALML